MRRLALLLLVALAGCKKSDPPPVVEKLAPGTEKIELAASATPEALPTTYLGPVVAYSKAGGLVVDGQQVLAAGTEEGFPPAAKGPASGGLMLTTLAEKITTKPEGALIAIEGTTPYRIVAEMVFTLGQSAVGRYDFLVERAKKRGLLPLSPARTGDLACAMPSPANIAEMERQLLDALAGVDAGGIKLPPKDAGANDAGRIDGGSLEERTPLGSRSELCLTVSIKDGGIAVRSHGDLIEPTCKALAPIHATTPTIPKDAPPGALDGCIAQLTALQRGKVPVTVSAKRETQWQEVVNALDAVRKAGLTPVLGLDRS